jgi:hypothetical protein
MPSRVQRSIVLVDQGELAVIHLRTEIGCSSLEEAVSSKDFALYLELVPNPDQKSRQGKRQSAH